MRAFLTESRPLSPPLSSVPPASVSLYNGGRGRSRSLSWRPACTQAGERASRTFHSDYLYNSAMAYSTLLYSTVLPSLPPSLHPSIYPCVPRSPESTLTVTAADDSRGRTTGRPQKGQLTYSLSAATAAARTTTKEEKKEKSSFNSPRITLYSGETASAVTVSVERDNKLASCAASKSH